MVKFLHCISMKAIVYSRAWPLNCLWSISLCFSFCRSKWKLSAIKDKVRHVTIEISQISHVNWYAFFFLFPPFCYWNICFEMSNGHMLLMCFVFCSTGDRVLTLLTIASCFKISEYEWGLMKNLHRKGAVMSLHCFGILSRDIKQNYCWHIYRRSCRCSIFGILCICWGL